MRNILMLTGANLRKSKGQTASLFALVLISAMFLNIGLVIIMGISAFFDQRAEETEAEHITVIYSNAGSGGSVNELIHYVEEYPSVKETQVRETVGGVGNYVMNGMENLAYLYLAKNDENLKMGEPCLIGESRPLTGDAIYIPYFMSLIGEFELGDKFELNLLGEKLNFTYAGASEEIMMGAQFDAVYRFYISDEKYDEMKEKFPDGGFAFISARLEDPEEAHRLETDINKYYSNDRLNFVLRLVNAKMSRTTVSLIASVIIAAFAVILLIVSLIVIRFRIVNTIDESMTNIGSLKAVGFRNRQIISSIVGQFGIVSLFGGLAGIALSYAVLPIISGALKPMFALDWKPSFDFSMTAISLLTILLTITLTSLLSARKIRKLHPLIALRGGITTHNFKRNPFPLEKSGGSLNFLLALKQLFQNKKQAITICVIVAAVIAPSVAGVATNYTMNQNKDDFARQIFGEIPEVNFVLKEGVDGEAFKERMANRPEVRKTFAFSAFSGSSLLVEDFNLSQTITEDCSLMESKMLIAGRYPKHNNEIALGAGITKTTGKKIGDMVTVELEGVKKQFIVVGKVQYMNNGGFNGVMTTGGMKELNPDFIMTDYNVYLHSRDDVKGFIEGVKADEGDIFVNITNMDDMLISTISTMGGIFSAVAVGILVVTAFVVILTLNMVIKTTILRRKRELGIQKAVGFTTFQLMNQIALNLTPSILLGAVIGAVGGYFGFNPMMTAFLISSGIARTEFTVPIDQTVIVCAGLVVLAYAISMIVSLRIRKISAYSLITE